MNTVFKRKVYDKLLDWKNSSNGKTALIIEGARRVGKSTVAIEFAKNEYPDYLVIDFSDCSEDVYKVFDFGLQDIESFFTNLFLSLGNGALKKGSLIIFDEIQFCPKARQAIKKLVADGRYSYIETGSLISIKENVKDILIPSEEEKIDMYPMDYEEFMWAIGKEFEASVLVDMYHSRNVSLSNQQHSTLIKTLRMYMAIGGMPQAVATYVETKDYYAVEKVKKTILRLYEQDIRKIDEKYGTICELIWKQMPSMLCHGNTRFIISSVQQRASSVLFQNSLEKLVESKMATLVYRCNEPKIGFKLTEDLAYLKLYFCDTGLFTSIIYMENDEEDADIYQRLILRKLDTNLGMLYENLACQFLIANNHHPHYYTWSEMIKNEDGEEKKKTYEVDFLVYHKGKVIPIETKSNSGKSIKSLEAFKKVYSHGTGERYVVCNKPLKYGDNLTYLPFYLLHLI